MLIILKLKFNLTFIYFKFIFNLYLKNEGLSMDIKKMEPDLQAPYQRMYVTLFKAVTAALYMMEDGEVMKARGVLVRAQQETEEQYVEAGGPEL